MQHNIKIRVAVFRPDNELLCLIFNESLKSTILPLLVMKSSIYSSIIDIKVAVCIVRCVL